MSTSVNANATASTNSNAWLKRLGKSLHGWLTSDSFTELLAQVAVAIFIGSLTGLIIPLVKGMLSTANIAGWYALLGAGIAVVVNLVTLVIYQIKK